MDTIETETVVDLEDRAEIPLDKEALAAA